MISLAGRRALVTGGSRGIGAATARLLASAGARVAVACRSRVAEAEQVVDHIRSANGEARAFAADLGDAAEVERLFAAAGAWLGGFDLVVANAGTWPAEERAVAELPESRWRGTLRDNLDAIYFTSRLAARALSDDGRLVLLSSTAGQRGEAFHADYAAAKGATISLVKSLAIELAPRGITVNAVAPGWVDTAMIASATANEGYDRIAATIPLGRIASAEDVAGPIAFLCSDLARHITGEVLNVNGGSVLCG